MRNRFFLILVAVSFVSMAAMAQDAAALRKKEFNLDGNIAIDGYDPVAYFKANKAIKGKKDLAGEPPGRDLLFFFRRK